MFKRIAQTCHHTSCSAVQRKPTRYTEAGPSCFSISRRLSTLLVRLTKANWIASSVREHGCVLDQWQTPDSNISPTCLHSGSWIRCDSSEEVVERAAWCLAMSTLKHYTLSENRCAIPTCALPLMPTRSHHVGAPPAQ